MTSLALKVPSAFSNVFRATSNPAQTEVLAASDAVVGMKIGRNFSKVRDAVAAAGLLKRAMYVERGTQAGEVVMPLADKLDNAAPYFSMVLVPGHGRRP